jgi:hypothetical protein
VFVARSRSLLAFEGIACRRTTSLASGHRNEDQREAHGNVRPGSELSLHLDFEVYGSRSSDESRFHRREVIDICGPSSVWESKPRVI